MGFRPQTTGSFFYADKRTNQEKRLVIVESVLSENLCIETYVLCEINVGSVAPFPESAPPYIAEAVLVKTNCEL